MERSGGRAIHVCELVRRTLNVSAAVGAIVLVVASYALLVPGAVSQAAGLLPPNNPSANLTSDPPLGCASSQSCTGLALRAIDNAHAAEGASPMELPSNWFTLSPQQQLFVVAGEERIDRGLKPYKGLLATLDAIAQTAAVQGEDPTLSRIPFPILAAGGNYAGGYATVLSADYDWMEVDGYGGPNVTCTTPTAAGCWGHRDNILGMGTCPTCVAGAGYIEGSYTELFARPRAPVNSFTFSWQSDVAPYLADPITATSLSGGPSTTKATWVNNPMLPNGYWLLGRDGGVYAFGNAQFYGSTGGMSLNEPVVAMTPTADDRGYWLVARDGGIFAFGDAEFHGSVPEFSTADNVVAAAEDPETGGYWEVGSGGQVYAFDAPYLGNAPSDAAIVGISPTPTGHGYWMVAADGGIFAFGSARFYGSMGGHPLDEPIVGMAVTTDGLGYWMVASDGGIFAFGDASFEGSMGGRPLVRPMVGMGRVTDGSGYWTVASDGGIFSFGGAPFYGSMGGQHLNAPVVGVAPS